jgi:hypothetical protein
VPCGSCKMFSDKSGSLSSELSSDEDWVPLKLVLGGVREVSVFHYLCQHTIKPSLQFSCNLIVFNCFRGITSFTIYLFGPRNYLHKISERRAISSQTLMIKVVKYCYDRFTPGLWILACTML